jgi:predicted MPP superfamily phosphohydrolase
MRGIPSSFLFLFFAVILLVELVSYSGIRLLINLAANAMRRCLYFFYILFSVIATGLIIFSFSNPELIRQSRDYSFFYLVILISFLNIIPKSFFAFMTLISFVFRWLSGKWSQLLILSGSFVIAAGIFLLIGYGNLWGRSNLNVERLDLYFDKLPLQLDGLIIVQLSDIHLGSFNMNSGVLKETVQLVNMTNPDLLLFTGDLVNNFADEIKEFEPYLSQLSAKLGKFAIQGNHDYGDYSTWSDSTSKNKNLELIRFGFTECGFKLLLNQWTKIEIQDTSFVLIGVENWGHPPFPQYAKLDQALKGIPKNSFRVLMTHDPAHWNTIVVPNTDIPLTLSGHTHGGQFCVKIAGIEFSPIYLIQKHWGGLYKTENQLLYVNRGLGTIGYQGRIDMRPEITVLTLHAAKNH